MRKSRLSWRDTVRLGALVAGLGVGCGVASDLGATSTSVASLSGTYAALSQASGTLVCTPAEEQIADCDGLAEGDACTLVSSDGTTTWAGSCRTTIDGATLACAPTPPAPPAELVSACTGLAAGAACQVTDKLGATRDGVCVAKAGALICGRKETPPAEATKACSGKVAGDACTAGGKKSFAGVCSLGPAGTGTLACTHARDLVSPAEAACAGLDAGSTCSMGKSPWALLGNCVTPTSGDSTLCVLPCGNVGGRFDCEGSKDADGGLYARGHGNRSGGKSGGGLPPGGGTQPGGNGTQPGGNGGFDGGLPSGGGTQPGGSGGGSAAGGGSGNSGSGGGSGGSTSSCVHNDSRCTQTCSTCHR